METERISMSAKSYSSTILVVHPHPENIKNLILALREREYNVILSDTIKRAIDSMQRKCGVDIIVMVKQLPDGEATDFLYFLHNDLRYRDIPTIIWTEEANVGMFMNLYRAGAKGFLRFPSTPNTLIEKIQELLEHTQRTILIAVSNTVCMNSLVRILLRDGFEVILAHTENDVFDILKTKAVDMAIVEPLVGNISPRKLLLGIKEIQPGTRVTLLVDKRTRMDYKKMNANGVDGIITKSPIGTNLH